MVKKIWTASFGIFAAGWTCLIFAFFQYSMEGLGFRKWAFPFQVAGMNSIFLYIVRGHSYQPHKEFGDAIHELSIRQTWRLGSGVTCHHRGDLPMGLGILAV